MLWRLFLFMSVILTCVSAEQRVKIGVLINRNADITLKNWSATAQYLERNIPQTHFEIVPLSFEKLHEHVRDKSIDFVLANTVYYVDLEYHYGVSRIATLNAKSMYDQGLSHFGAVIFTHKKSGISTIEGLRNKHFGVVNALSFGGWIMAQKELLNHDITADDFKTFHFLGSHDKVVYAVKDGLIDAGTVRTDILETMAKEHRINLDEFTILSAKTYADFPYRVSTELYPEWPLAKLASTSTSLANAVAIALLQMSSSDKAAHDANIQGWSIPLDYSKVHALLHELHLGPYEHLGKISWLQIYEQYTRWIYAGLIGLVIILLVVMYVNRLNGILKVKKADIEALNVGLEKRVEERTKELQKSYSHEKYLKNVLTTIANVNELLISSFSTQAVLENCMSTLTKHEQYRFIWIGLVEDTMLNVISQSKSHETFMSERSYHLNADEGNPLVNLAKSAIHNNQTIIEKLTHQEHMDCLACWVINLPLRAQKHDKPIGSLSVFSNKEDGFEDEEIHMLENLSTDIGMVLHAISQRSMLEMMEEQKLLNYEETILAFVSIIEQRDSYTAGHTLRVAEYCRLIAKDMGLNATLIKTLEKAAILHDIGKVVTPDAILLKPGALSAQEYELIKQHSFAGHKMLVQIEMYKDLADIILYHHARYDGKGYPSRSLEEQDTVPLLSYIMAVADAFDAMTTNRVYKAKKSVAQALDEVRRCSGTQFHPDVALHALTALEKVLPPDTTQLPSSDLEQRRFAYFFMDGLTDAYNENYLKMYLVKQCEEKRCLYIVELKKFSELNHSFGWEKGDSFLKEFVSTLKKLYPDAMIFRYHGDDFILLLEQHQTILQETLESLDMVREYNIKIALQHHNLSDHMPIL